MNTNSLKTQQLKKSLLFALERSMGNVTKACKLVKCDRTTYYDHYRKDLKFRAAVNELKDVALDFAEDALLKRIKKGDTIATIFYLKTQGKVRGYIERQELDDKPFKIKVSRK